MKRVAQDVSSEQLIADFKTVVADAEALLKATANQGGEEIANIRAKAEESLKSVKSRLNDEQAVLLLKTKQAAKATDTYIHDKPWQAVGMAAGVGLVLGLLSSRH